MSTASNLIPRAPRPQVGQRVCLREATFEDYPQIAVLSIRYGLRVRRYEEWADLWTTNPAYLQLGGKWPIGWVLHRGNEIVGYIGNIPALYELQRRTLLTALGCCWVVDAPYRGYSILLMDKFLTQNSPELFLGSRANAEASNVLDVLGASRVPVGQWDRTTYWITAYHAFATEWLRRKQIPAAPAGALPIALALRIRDMFHKRQLRAERRGVELRWLESFDARFDDFWQVLKREKQEQLLCVRTQDMLRWHFRPAEARKKLWILTAQENERLVAYSIFLKRSYNGCTRALLADFQQIGGRADLIEPMLAAALDRCSKEIVPRLEIVGLRAGDLEVKGLAPYERPLPAWTFYFKANDRAGLAKVLRNPEVWSPSMMDGDGTL
jgi:hypothetical protein